MRGFTLTELLITLAVLIILITVAAPAWHVFFAINQTAGDVNRLISAIELARSEAIKQRSRVTLCPSIDQKQCSGYWEKGQIIFFDKEGRGVVDSPSTVLRVFSPLATGATLHWQGFGTTEYLQMSPIGITNQQNGTFIYCPPSRDAHYARAIFISKQGRVRLSQDDDHDGVDEDADGKPLHCG